MNDFKSVHLFDGWNFEFSNIFNYFSDYIVKKAERLRQKINCSSENLFSLYVVAKLCPDMEKALELLEEGKIATSAKKAMKDERKSLECEDPDASAFENKNGNCRNFVSKIHKSFGTPKRFNHQNFYRNFAYSVLLANIYYLNWVSEAYF